LGQLPRKLDLAKWRCRKKNWECNKKSPFFGILARCIWHPKRASSVKLQRRVLGSFSLSVLPTIYHFDLNNFYLTRGWKSGKWYLIWPKMLSFFVSFYLYCTPNICTRFVFPLFLPQCFQNICCRSQQHFVFVFWLFWNGFQNLFQEILKWMSTSISLIYFLKLMIKSV